jgi:hypothetical protein
MENILNLITQNIEAITAIVIALSGLIALVITKYRELKSMLETTKELQKAANPLYATAETKPLFLYQELDNRPVILGAVDSNEGKNSIVTQALIERKPSLLKKLKLKDFLSVSKWVAENYQIVKPAIKALK